jgi:hypothetical protein
MWYTLPIYYIFLKRKTDGGIYLSSSFGTEDLEEHIRNVLLTDFIKKATPVSTLIVAPPERNKSNTVIKFKGKTILTLNDLTAYGLMKELEQKTKNGKCQLGHLIIPDLTRLTARSRSVRKELITTLQILMAEGIEGIHTYNIEISFKKPLKLGLITCITRRDLSDHRTVWSKIGFLSRLIPFSFDYDEQMKLDILKFINKERTPKLNLLKIKKRAAQTIVVPEEIQLYLEKDARRMAFNLEKFCETPTKYRAFGARALHQLLAYIKAICLRHNETTVNFHHYELFKNLFTHFNYDCELILSRQSIIPDNHQKIDGGHV